MFLYRSYPALKEQLVKVSKHAEQYKQLAGSVEQNLHEQNMVCLWASVYKCVCCISDTAMALY